MDADLPTDVLFIGGRAGVGKSTVAAEVSHLLASNTVHHALIEGDNLDQAYPEPWREGVDLAEQNLAAMWKNYRNAGYRRLIYTNTVSVLQMRPLVAALGGKVRGVGVLLVASDETARSRLTRREIGSALDEHVQRSSAAARQLATEAGPAVHRVNTDSRTVNEIAHDLVSLTRWLDTQDRPD
ncbi:adenylyl-sulfate kinase [Lacisediminihabitans changchengi]|uniref:Adenylyl-sulfate kinase n=1 Tax=Lacisediminihabitans changchengi TaxID=2787634 RepID=A0A934SP22_9MICO|nr:adenylyl-sulfate kinase [Lacisediminihabitans changchengi]MBK4348986.1 adenylyl-sulfate kinase [Lacisediminihabitans changchengi]